MSYSILKETWLSELDTKEDYNAILRHVEKTGGASLRMSIGCKCAGGADIKHGETRPGTHGCQDSTESNGVLCLGHTDRISDYENDGKTPYYVILRNPLTRYPSFRKYHWYKTGKEYQRYKSVNEYLKTKEGNNVNNVKFLCYEDLENEYKKLKENTPGSHLWDDQLEHIHIAKYDEDEMLTESELELLKVIHKDEYKLWKHHCGHLEK